jgi:beta-1,4-glucosyltransferase
MKAGKDGVMAQNLSVLILAKNEEQNIEDCIRSVSFADEVVVIDDFSTDRTVELSRACGARVVQRALAGDWGAQQTFAVGEAACDWIYFLDADERVTSQLAERIKEIVAADDRRYAYANARLSYYFEQPLRHGGWFPDYVVRLLPRDGTSVTGLVHPKICHPYQEIKLPRKAYLVHYPYRDWVHYLGKLNTYTTLAAQKSYNAGRRANLADMILHPVWASFRMYFLKCGFLDGRIGFILAVFHYFYTMAKYVKLYYLDRMNRHTGDVS